MTNSVQLRIQIPESMIEKVRYEDELDYDWWHDVLECYFDEHPDDFNGIWHDAWEWESSKKTRRKWNVEFDLFRQGEYAFFPCGVRNWELFLTARNLEDKFPLVLRYHRDGQGNDIELIAKQHRYNSCSFCIDFEEYNVSWAWNDVDPDVAELLDKLLYDEIDQLKVLVEDEVQDLFDKLEDELKAEYDWRHSDEYISDMIDANWHHDEIVSYCLENDEPVVWQSANC